MTWLPKFVVCLSYYDRFRFRSDAFAALFLALQIFPLTIAIAVATGVPPLYGVFCAAIAGLLASVFGDSKYRWESWPSRLTSAFVNFERVCEALGFALSD